MKTTPPARANVIVLKQLLNLIPRGIINEVARDTDIGKKVRTFSVTGHLATMIFAQMTHALSLTTVSVTASTY